MSENAANRAESVEQGSSALEWVRAPQQSRSQKTLEKIVGAALRLFGEKGVEITTVSDITREARCSVGLFYTRFKDRDELLRYLVERYLAEALDTARGTLNPARWEGIPTIEIVRLVADFLVRVYREQPGIFVAFFYGAKTNDDLAARMNEVQSEVYRLVHALLATRRGDIAHPDLPVATAFAISLSVGLVHNGILARQINPRLKSVPDKLFREELVRNLCAYLGIAS